ncbi:phage portal protein, partial [Streptococcus sobrinus]|uniref:phage portal protein n=1 Tax=Streptococcus sobrinus TaxID=1310 RepID=UPI0005B383F1
NITNVLDENNFMKEFQRYLEYSFALGGMVIKVYWDNGIKLSYVTADCFVPISWDNKSITEGVFVNEFRKG